MTSRLDRGDFPWSDDGGTYAFAAPAARSGVHGRLSRRVVVVGPADPVLDVVRRLSADPAPGPRVVGVCLPRTVEAADLAVEGIRVLGGLADVRRAVLTESADAVLVIPGADTDGGYLRDLNRQLAGTGVQLLVEGEEGRTASPPSLGGPRPAVPLVVVDARDLSGRRPLLKLVLDCLGATVLLLVAAPWMILIALAVRIDGSEPVLTRHRRLGQWGHEFELLRFRTTVRDGGREVSRTGRVLRRYSLDELPQLLNVLRGDMSLVGPRPQRLPVADGDRTARQQWLPVRPGLTGLWHLGSSSRADQDRPVGLGDYAQHWSLRIDLGILWRSVRSVLRSGGAL